MHGMIGMNRKGRKRKSGRRVPSGDIARKAVDYRSMAAAQPHRRTLPEALRLSEKAGSVIGCLNLLNRISDEMYEAGRRYSSIVGAYLAMANAPRGVSGQGRGYDCVGALNCPAETCICLARTIRFNNAYEAISEAAEPVRANQIHKAINWVVIQDHPCTPDGLDALKVGLSALAKHFGLTNHRR